MKTSTFVALITGLLAAPAVYAECPISLPHEQLIDCIVKENATEIREKELFEDQIVSKQGDLQLNPQSSKVVELQVQK